MKMSRLAVVFPAALLLAQPVHADPLRADHPLIGSWKLDIPNPKCSETYRIRKDGTALITSADEVSETTFTISDKPTAKGFYKWVDKVVKDNGKKDCSGELMKVGQELTSYIMLHPSGNLFLLCEKEDINTCIGPLQKQKDGDG